MIGSSLSQGGLLEILVRPFPGPGGKWQISRGGGTEPRWSPSGDALYYHWEEKLFRVPIDTTSGFEAGEVETVTDGLLRRFETGTYDVGSDGRVIIISSPLEDRTREEIGVILGWSSGLGSR